MADKEKIIEEIKRRMDNLWYLIPEGEKVLQDNFTKEDANNLGKYTALESILQFIDSLSEESGCEVNFTTKNEDLEEEIDRYYSDWQFDDDTIYEDMRDICRHFAEWQKQKDLEDFIKSDMNMPNKFYEKGKADVMKEMKEALQTEYEQGRFDMREEMMKNAVLETKVMMDCDGDGIETPYEEWLTFENTEIPYIPDNLGLKEGDKVKIVVLKTE